MQQEIEHFLGRLTSDMVDGFGATWGTFLFNVAQAQTIGVIDKVLALQVVEAGIRWTTADGWTTSRASQKLFSLTSVPLVSSDFKEYRNAWLYALTMMWGIDVETLQLSDRSAEAAFSLAAVLAGENGPAGGGAAAEQEGAKPPQAPEEEEDLVLAWEEVEESLPPELKHLVEKVQRREQKLNLKDMLTTVPTFKELSRVAPVNNHRQDGNPCRTRTSGPTSSPCYTYSGY